MSTGTLTQKLNPQQHKALKYNDGPLLVLAGAGSGKTKLIAHKYAYLVKRKKISPDALFTVTFSNKAASQMKEKINGLINRHTNYSWIGTFHSQCSRILRNEIKNIGYSADFTIYDENDRCALIRHILKEFKIYEALYKGVSSRISHLKTSLIGPEEFLSSGDGYGFDEKLAKVYIRYQDELKRSNALDFNDLVMLAVKLFEEYPRILRKYQNSFSHLLIDEFQDVNYAQYKCIKLLAKRHGNICAAGDDDQGIYKYRGADIQHLMNFEKDFPGSKIVRLERNYRSTQNIIDVSSAVISFNIRRKDKKLWTDRGCGEKVHFCWLNSEEEEAKHTAKIIKEFFLKGLYPYKDVGIFYRVNLQSRAIEEALRGAGLPYTVVGGAGFYNQKEIKDIIAYARLILNNKDNVSLRRIINCPPRGIGAATLAKIENDAKKKSICLFDALKLCVRGNGVVTSTKEKLDNFVKLIEKISSASYKTADGLFKNILDKTGHLALAGDDRKQNIDELISSAEGKDIREFIDKVSLMTNLDESAEGDCISLMTLHNAKGCAFSVVFITGLEEGLLPYFKANGSDDEISEERRLLYVGMTRAKSHLFLTGARKRRLYSRIQEQEPSRFLKDIPKEHCRWIEKVSSPQALKGLSAKNKIHVKKVRPVFAAGCRVKHPVWGEGVVRDCYGAGKDQKVTVSFPSIGIKRLSLQIAHLIKL